MQTRIRKWGNSLGLRIPAAFAKEVEIQAGAVVEIHLDGGRIVIRPVRAPVYRLEELLAGVTRRNLHDEVDTGEATGREAW